MKSKLILFFSIGTLMVIMGTIVKLNNHESFAASLLLFGSFPFYYRSIWYLIRIIRLAKAQRN
jgi:hypothetical protein